MEERTYELRCGVCGWSTNTDSTVAEGSYNALEHYIQTGHSPIDRVEHSERRPQSSHITSKDQFPIL